MPPRPAPEQTGPLGWFLHLLHHLGWSGAAIGRAQRLAKGRSPWARAEFAALSLPDGQPLLVLATGTELPPPSLLLEAFEDLSTEHRSIAAALARTMTPPRHVVLLAPSGAAQLVDHAQEEIVLATGSRGETEERLLPMLDTVALLKGSLSGHQRRSPFRRAQDLQRWAQLWMRRVGSELGIPREAITRWFQWLLMTRLATDAGCVAGRGGVLSSWCIDGSERTAARVLDELWRHLSSRTNLLQGDSVDAMCRVTAAAARGGVLHPCLSSLSRLSRGKFGSDILAEAFSDEDLRQLSWRQGLLEPGAGVAASACLTEPACIDLDERGTIVMLRELDRLAEGLLEYCRDQEAQRRMGDVAGLQMDVFGTEPPTLVAEEDVPRFLLDRGLAVRTTSRARAEVARIALLARGLEWNVRLGRPGAALPAVVVAIETPEAAPPPPPVVPPRGSGDPSLN